MKRTMIILLCITFSTFAYGESKTHIYIGSGPKTGLYFPIAEAICHLVNRYNHKMLCTDSVSNGSVDNLKNLRKGKVQFALVQSDWQHHAYHGTGQFKKQAHFSNLRNVVSLHSEPFTVIVRADSAIKQFAQLKGKRIAIGNQGSGTQATVKQVMHLLKWQDSDIKAIDNLSLTQQANDLCAKKIDASIVMLGHPNKTFHNITKQCPIRILSLSPANVSKIIEGNPFYFPITIAANTYYDNHLPIHTFALQANLVTTTKTPNWQVYELVKTIFNHFKLFKLAHPSLKTLKSKTMLTNNITPFATGALKYYKERGWIFHMAQ